jgi:PAS domain S-box-containing protein
VIIAVTVALIIGYFFIALAISSHLSKPIYRLIEKFRAGVRGNLSVRLDEASTAETKELSHWFNTFMEQLNAYQESLKNEILERKHTQKDLEQSESKYRLLADNIRDVIWMVDMNMQYTYVSISSLIFHGWSPDEMLKMTIDQTLTPAAFETAARIIAEEIDAGESSGNFERSKAVELELNRKDGSTVWSEVTATFILGEDGKPCGILGVARDISERRIAERENRELQEQLARSKKMEALGVLAGCVAHDLNNVLSGIASYPDLLLMDMPEDSPLRAPLVTIKESGRKAASIVQDLLTLARRGVTITKIVNLKDVVTASLETPNTRNSLPSTRISTTRSTSRKAFPISWVPRFI